MKVVLNECYGGFGLSEAFVNKYPQFEDINYSYDENDRIKVDFIEALEEFGVNEASGDCASLVIVEISDDCTDWEIIENDGDETIIYVLDGKIHRAF